MLSNVDKDVLDDERFKTMLIDNNNLIEILVRAMEIVEDTGKAGSSKKQQVIRLVIYLINNSPLLDEDERENIVKIASRVLSPTIDVIIASYHKVYHLSQGCTKRKWKKTFCCL